MHDGAKADLVYAAAVEFIKNKKPELEKHLMKNIGFAVRYSFTSHPPSVMLSSPWNRLDLSSETASGC
jgi:nucleosome binding factor SPN SPT16 subunit